MQHRAVVLWGAFGEREQIYLQIAPSALVVVAEATILHALIIRN